MRLFYVGFLLIPLYAAPQAIRLPLTFEENRGQFAAPTRFVARTGEHAFAISPSEASFDGVCMRFPGSNPQASIEGVDRLAARSNYLNGSNRQRWITGAPHYAQVRQRGVYPGLDVLYYANAEQIEFDLEVSPGANPKDIRVGFSGVDSFRIDLEGHLQLRSGSRRFTLRRPVAYQEIGGHRQAVPIAYLLEGPRTVRVRLGAYDSSQRLVIDPVLVYATFLGGAGSDAIVALATDSQNNLYVTGSTASSDVAGFQALPGVNTERQVVASSDAGANWTNLSDLPSGLIYSLAIDPHTPTTLFAGGYDNVYKSTDSGKHWRATHVTFPAGAIFLPVPAAAISVTGILYLAVDPQNPRNLFAARQPGGVIRSTDGGENWTPANTGLSGDTRSLYVNLLALDPLHPSTLYVGTFNGLFRSVDGANTWTPVNFGFSGVGRLLFDPSKAGVLYVQTQSGLLKSVDSGQTWNGLNSPRAGNTPYLLAIDPINSNTLYAALNPGLIRSLDGGNTWQTISDSGLGFLAIDPGNSRNLVAAINGQLARSTDGGATWLNTFPGVSRFVHSLFFDPSGSGQVYAAVGKASDIFVAKLNPAGDTLLYATYFGGNGYDFPRAMAVDAGGSVVIGGMTQSLDFPVTAGAVQPRPHGSSPGFVVRLNAAGDGLLYSTYLGGSNFDLINSIAVDSAANAYLTGTAYSGDFPVTPRAWQTTFGGASQASASAPPDAFVTKLSPDGQLVYSTYLGGSYTDQGNAIAVDANGSAIVTGVTSSMNFPVTSGATQKGLLAASDAFLTRLDPAGANLIYSTLLGGRNDDSGRAVVLGPSGDIFLAGGSASADFPITPGAFQGQIHSGSCSYSLGCAPGCIGPSLGFQPATDAFVARLSGDGATLRWATFVGGECATSLAGLAVDAAGNAYFTGNTLSHEFPRISPIQNTIAACGDFVSVAGGLNAAGSALLFATYLDTGYSPSLALDSGQNLYVGGQGCGGALIAGPSLQAKSSDGADGYLVKLDLSSRSALALNSAANAFSLLSGPVSPGELVMLRGTGIGPDAGVDLGIHPSAPPTTTLAGVQVYFDDVAVPVVSAQAGWVMCMAPNSLAGHASTCIQVEYQGQRSNALQTPVAELTPGLLTLDGSGQGQLNIRNQDGTLNSASNPAARGDVATIFATGLGLESAAGVDTIADGSPSRPQQMVHLYVGNMEATILDVSSLPGFLRGMFQIWIQVPQAATPSSTANVTVTGGIATGLQPTTMAIR